MSVNTSDVVKAQEKVLGGAQEPKTVSEEPISGVKGAGTTDEPYDQGNQAEQTANPGTEPVSGQSGKGTIDEPYDGGNQPENKSSVAHKLNSTQTPKQDHPTSVSIVDELSRTKPPKNKVEPIDTTSSQTNGTPATTNATSTPIEQTEDRRLSIIDQLSKTKAQKNRITRIDTASSQANGTPTVTEEAATPVEKTENRKMSIIDQLSRTKTKEERAAAKHKKAPSMEETDEERGRDEASTPTTASNPKAEKLKPRARPVVERSVSPGQLNDGTHVRCSGERGEAYTPPGKIMAKLHLGKH